MRAVSEFSVAGNWSEALVQPRNRSISEDCLLVLPDLQNTNCSTGNQSASEVCVLIEPELNCTDDGVDSNCTNSTIQGKQV